MKEGYRVVVRREAPRSGSGQPVAYGVKLPHAGQVEADDAEYREQQNDRMPENEGIVRKENPAKTEAGAAGVCTCGVCGSVNNPAHKYCIICGAVLQGTEKTPHGSSDESDTVYCPNCGMKNRMGGSYCINCGSRL